MKPKYLLAILLASSAGMGFANAQQSWRIDGTSATWTGSNWSNTGVAPFTTAWASGSNVQFNATSAATFETTTVGNVTVSDGVTVTVTQKGTLSTGSASARTYNIGTGSTLNWATQNVSTSANQAGFIKSGEGIWNIGAQGNAYNAANSGFTLNAGTVIVGGNNSFGSTNSLLTINGGTIQSSGTRAYANSAITIGGNFINSGTGNATFSGTVGLGAATRTITNSLTSGSRIYSGVISGASGTGLTFAGSGAGETAITNAANTFTGDITITGGEVRFTTDGSMGNAANDIVIDGGRFATASGSTFTLGAGRSISIGDTAGTSISTPGAGTFTINTAIADISTKTGAWAKQGGGTLELGGASTYTGNTSINNGILRLTTGNNRLPTGTVVSLGQAASTNLGTLDLNGNSQAIAGLNSTAGNNMTVNNANVVTSATAATLTINAATSTTHVYSAGTAADSGNITGSVALAKLGEGTQVLGGANTYTGTTSITEGILLIEGTHTGGAAYTVGSAGAIGGGGSIESSLNFAAGAGFVFNPLNTLTINGALNDVTFAGFSVANLFGLDGTVANDTYLLMDGTATFDFTNVSNIGLANAASIGGGKSAYFTTGSLSVTVIPEPSAALLGGIGALLLLRRRR